MKINLFFALFLIVLPCTGFSQEPIVWDENSGSTGIGDKVWIVEDKNFTIEEVSSDEFASKYEPSTQKILNFSNTNFYWLKFILQNKTDEKLLLEIAQPIVANAELYVKDSLGKWRNLRAGYQVPLSEKAYKHQYQIFPLEQKGSEYFVKIQSKGMSLPMKIWEADQYEDKSSIQKFTFGIFTGLMIFVVLINLFLFFSLRKFLYIHYSILVFFYYKFSQHI
jgi:hypothetical protein